MQTLPSTAEGLIAGCVIALAIAIAAACGVGASSRIVGIQMPAVGRSRATWIQGHRAALWIMIPAFVTAPLLVLVPSDPRLGAGWLVWFAGIGGGALAAMARAQRLVLDEPSQDSPGSETPRRTRMLEFRTYDLIWSAVYIVMVTTALVLMILGCVALVKYIRTPRKDD